MTHILWKGYVETLVITYQPFGNSGNYLPHSSLVVIFFQLVALSSV